MRFIPELAHQEWLVSRLAELLRERGSQRFLEAPIVLLTPEFFPDKWGGDEASVRRLLRRILSYAGLSELGFEVELYDQARENFGHLHVEGVHHVNDAAAWFAGLDDDGTAHFGVASYHLDEPEALPGTLCHEVAHAYRARHGLTYFDDVEDELLTDLTTVFLGFGVLTTNLSLRYRKRREAATREMAGYLSPVAMSFALAAQAVCRKLSLKDAKRLARQLEPAQEGCFIESFKELSRSPEPLITSLGLNEAREAVNQGQPVFRIKQGWFRKSRCSGLDCGMDLKQDDTRCPRCGGAIRGDVHTEAEATAAEAALTAEVGTALLSKLRRGR